MVKKRNHRLTLDIIDDSDFWTTLLYHLLIYNYWLFIVNRVWIISSPPLLTKDSELVFIQNIEQIEAISLKDEISFQLVSCYIISVLHRILWNTSTYLCNNKQSEVKTCDEFTVKYKKLHKAWKYCWRSSVLYRFCSYQPRQHERDCFCCLKL